MGISTSTDTGPANNSARTAAGSSTTSPSVEPVAVAGIKRKKLQSRASTGDLRISLVKRAKTTPRRAVSSVIPVTRSAVAAPAPPDSSSEESSSDESSSEGESSSEDDPDTSTSSSEPSSSISTSSSSSASSPEELPTRRKQQPPNAFPPIPPGLLSRAATTETHVPPGQGKSSTQNRNARRRRARLLKKLGEEGSGVDTSLVVENGQLENGRKEEMPLQEGVPTQIANNNKRKGFLKDMTKVRATKTVFESDENGDAIGATNGNAPQDNADRAWDATADVSMLSTISVTPGGNKRRPRIVFPSAQTLPSNVFITSAQFQHPPRPKTRKRAAVLAYDESFDVNSSGDGVKDVYAEMDESTFVDPENEVDEADEEAAMNEFKEVDEWAIWDTAEKTFDSLPSLTSVSDEGLSKVGVLVVWKELELNMTTFSPELRVQLARPTATENEAGGDQPHVLQMKKLRRPIEDEEEDPAGEAETEEVILTLTEEDLQREPGKWKVLVV